MRARPPRRTMRSPPCGRHANAGSPSPDNALLTAFFRSLLAESGAPPGFARDECLATGGLAGRVYDRAHRRRREERFAATLVTLLRVGQRESRRAAEQS